jgi:hypothetical protein
MNESELTHNKSIITEDDEELHGNLYKFTLMRIPIGQAYDDPISAVNGYVDGVSRRAKLAASCGVKVPVGQGLATHPYRVLRPGRSLEDEQAG